MDSRACWRPRCCCLEATRVSLATAQSWGRTCFRHARSPSLPGTGSSGVVPAPDAPEGPLSSTSQTTVTGGRTAPLNYFIEGRVSEPCPQAGATSSPVLQVTSL